jgi:hypothetical protein
LRHIFDPHAVTLFDGSSSDWETSDLVCIVGIAEILAGFSSDRCVRGVVPFVPCAIRKNRVVDKGG